jgi:purine-binding chemotaxis protein CheW
MTTQTMDKPAATTIRTTDALAAKGAAGPREGEQQLQLVTFGLGEEEFAVDILSVREINRMMSLTRVPQSPAEVEGVINLRGKIIPVVDLRKRFGLAQAAHSEQSRIVVVEVHGRVIGFIVDRVSEVLRISSRIVEPAPAMACSVESDFIAGVGKLEDRLLILLDLARLFDAPRVASMTAGAAQAA